MKLNKSKVEALPTPIDNKQKIHWDSETRGFGVRVSGNGSKSWVVQGRINGRSCRYTLAPVHLLSADAARKRATAMLLDMYDGIDPMEAKRKRKAQTLTLREAMEQYLQHKAKKSRPMRPASVQDIRRAIDKAFSIWADKPVTDITRNACIKRFKELSQTAPVSTNKDFRNLRAILNWVRECHATNEGVYTILPINPVSQMFRGGLVSWNPQVRKTTRIPLRYIGDVWQLLERCSDSDFHLPIMCTSTDLVAFMLLTGTRVGETRRLTWDRVHLDTELPTFHLDVVKNHNPITLPISDALKIVLERRKAAKHSKSNFVFPSPTSSSGHIKESRTVFNKIEEITGEHVHAHALRRTFDSIAQQVGIDGDQRRHLLNHITTDVHGQSYSNDNSPETLMPAAQKIGDWVLNEASISNAKLSGANVVTLNA